MSPASITVEAFVSLASTPTATTAARHSSGTLGLCNDVSSSSSSTDSIWKQQRSPRALQLLLQPSRSNDERPRRSLAVPPLASVAASGGDSSEVTASTGGTETGSKSKRKKGKGSKKKQDEERVKVTTVAEMRKLLSEGKGLFELDARGDSQEMLEGREDDHPVLEVLRKRANAGTKPGSHGDALKVGDPKTKIQLLQCTI